MSYDEAQGYVVLSCLAMPILAALAILLTPGAQKMAIRYIALFFATAMLGLSVYIFVAYQVGGDDIQMSLRWAWVENTAFLGENGISLHLGVDGISALLVLLNGIVAFAGTITSWKLDYRPKDFFILFFVLVTGVYGTFFSLDLFFWFFFYELAVVPLYLLIGVWGSTRKEYGAMKLTLMLVAGSVLIWIGIFAVFNEAGLGTFDLPTLWRAGEDGILLDRTFQKIFFPFMVIGCGVLAALWPFHTWSPDGHMSAPTAVSMVHAGVLMKLGAFGIIRLGIQLMPEGAEFWMPGLMVLGTVGAVYGATAALTQRDFKLISGYSSVSHMGYVLMGLATMNDIGVTGAVLQMFSHGVMTALVFLMIGALYDQAHTRDLKDFGGIAKVMPVWVIFYTIAGLANVGLPGLSGFTAEFHIFVGTFQSYPIFGGLAVFAAALAAAYMLRMFSVVFFGPFNPRWSSLKDVRPLEMIAGGTLIASMLLMGIWWAPFTDRVSATVTQLPGVLG